MHLGTLKRQLGPSLCGFLAATGFHRIARPVFAGLGCILNLHRVLPASSGPRLNAVKALEVTPEWIDQSIRFFRGQGTGIIDLDTMRAMLLGQIPVRRFVVYTFDDGYADNLIHALPVFQRHQAPFTVFVATHFPDRQLVPWWLLLEELILAHPAVRCRLDGQLLEFECRRPEQREFAFYRVRSAILRRIGADYRGTLEQVFGPYGIDLSRHAELGLDWAQVRELSRDPLVTLGAHGVRHVPLAPLTARELATELLDSRERLEQETGRPVRHFAFPYGSKEEAGEREFAAAAGAGYRTCVTTRSANIFASHRDHLACLPRNPISGQREGQDVRLLGLWTSGAIPALKNRFRQVVTT